MPVALVRPLVAAVLVAAASLRATTCRSVDKPGAVDIEHFSTGRSLTDTLSRLLPAGTPVADARELMERNGFRCDERRDTMVDVDAHRTFPGPSFVECFQTDHINLGLQRREWSVRFGLDSARVREIVAGYILQP